MKKNWLDVVACFAGLLILGGFIAYSYGVPLSRAKMLSNDSSKTVGLSKQEVVGRFGPAEKTYSYSKYADSHQKDIAHSFEPDPPNADCDEVLQYSELATMALFFVKDGVVVKTYSGGT